MKLKQWRTENGLTVGEVSKRWGVSEFTYGKWERGERMPRPAAIRNIAHWTDGHVTWPDFFDPPAKQSDSEAAA